MSISIIIPTYNEAAYIGKLVIYLTKNGGSKVEEIIVVDGGSTDNTANIAKRKGAQVIISDKKGRAAQMNRGVEKATGKILYFVHADTLPPKTFVEDIFIAVEEGYKIGGYRFKFDSDKLLLKLNAYLTRFNIIICRGGDQTLFVTRQLFDELGGYNDDQLIMEEYDFMKKARKENRFKVIQKDTLVSARKYDHNSYARVNFANFIAFNMWRLNFNRNRILSAYKSLLHHPKL